MNDGLVLMGENPPVPTQAVGAGGGEGVASLAVTTSLPPSLPSMHHVGPLTKRLQPVSASRPSRLVPFSPFSSQLRHAHHPYEYTRTCEAVTDPLTGLPFTAYTCM